MHYSAKLNDLVLDLSTYNYSCRCCNSLNISYYDWKSWIFFESSFLSYTLWLIKLKLVVHKSNHVMNHLLIASVSFWLPLDLFQQTPNWLIIIGWLANFDLHLNTPNEVRPSQMSAVWFKSVCAIIWFSISIRFQVYLQYNCNWSHVIHWSTSYCKPYAVTVFDLRYFSIDNNVYNMNTIHSTSAVLVLSSPQYSSVLTWMRHVYVQPNA